MAGPLRGSDRDGQTGAQRYKCRPRRSRMKVDAMLEECARTALGADDRSSSQQREVMIEMIRELPEGTVLPTERELCVEAGVSRATVRSVLQRLEAEQRIYRRQGKGTFVARAKIEQRLGLTSHTEEMRANGIQPGSKLINVSRIPADPEVAGALRLGPGAEVLQIERLRLADGEAIAIEVLYLNAERFDGISAALGENVSFYQLLHSDYGVELASAEETIEAAVAGPRESRLLGCGPAAALLLLSRLTFDTRGRPIEYVRSLYRGDRAGFRQRPRAWTPAFQGTERGPGSARAWPPTRRRWRRCSSPPGRTPIRAWSTRVCSTRSRSARSPTGCTTSSPHPDRRRCSPRPRVWTSTFGFVPSGPIKARPGAEQHHIYIYPVDPTASRRGTERQLRLNRRRSLSSPRRGGRT